MMEIDESIKKEMHTKSLVSSSSTTHLCKDCFRTFKDINNYKEHRFQEHQITEYPNIRKCSMCSYATLLKSKYDCHMRCHLNNKVIKCNRCDYSTINIRHMSRHERMHMLSSSEQKIPKVSAFAVLKKKYIKKPIETKTNDAKDSQNNLNFELIKNIITKHLEKQKEQTEGSHSLPTPPTSVQSNSSSPTQKYTPISPPPQQQQQQQTYEQTEYFYNVPPVYQPVPLFPFQYPIGYDSRAPHFHDSTGFCRHTAELEYLRKNVYKLLNYLMPHIVHMFNIDSSTIEKSQQIDKLIDYLLVNNLNDNSRLSS